MSDSFLRNRLSPEVLSRLDTKLETRVREERMGDGLLRVVETYVNGEKFAEVFTLESLAHCMGMPMSTMEGRYKRARLSRWMVPVFGMAGRPMRGFPYKLLEQVIAAIQHPRAFIEQDAQGSRVAIPKRKQMADLVPEYFLNERYYTVPALARAFGLSETAVRYKLNTCGLMRRFQNLAAPPQGGRRKRGIHERHMAEVKLALHDDAKFFTRYDMTLYRASGMLEEARREVKAAIVPHTPPAPNGLQAWDPYELAPVTKTPVNGVYSGANDSGQPRRGLDDLDELMADIERMSANLDLPPKPVSGEPVAGNTPQPVRVERSAADGTLDHYPTEREARQLEEAQAAANRRALVEPNIELLVKDKDDPTEEELDDTCYALALEGEDAQEFKRRVWEGRAARKQSLGA